MNLANIENILKKANIAEFRAEARFIAEVVSMMPIEKLLLEDDIPNYNKIVEIANKRAKTKIPVQYLLNCAYFMGEKYYVDNSVLIPRDETEFLVKKCYELIKNKKQKLDILDIGVGSGCVSLELAKLLKNHELEILGVDINPKSIITALKNTQKFDLIRKVVFRKSDIFSNIYNFEKFDLIVSNPPYIPINEKNNLDIELSFEPEAALFASDNEGVEFYRKIINKAHNYLKKDGFLVFELGIGQKDIVYSLLEQNFCEIDYLSDLAGIERVIWAKLKD